MKVETTIVIEADLLKEIDEFADKDNNRSEFVEKALREYLSKLMRERRDKRDAEIINRNADALNEEAMDVLSYQIDLWNAENFIEWRSLRRATRNGFAFSPLSAATHW